jgi:hypothetical protein
MMSPFERMLTAADEETFELVRKMFGREILALYVAKGIANRVGAKVDVDAVAEILHISTKSAYNKISQINLIP